MLKKVLRRLGVHNAIYDDAYYASDVEGPASEAAPHIAKSIIDQFKPASLVDVGCGTGAMMAAFRDRGVSVHGLEYADAGIARTRARGLSVTKFDIEREELQSRERYDVALSLEVAEHIPASKADRYVKLLATLAPVIIVSAAKPGQDGTDHVNLQPKSYWIENFAIADATFNQAATEDLKRRWRSARIAGFYHENLMVFQRK